MPALAAKLFERAAAHGFVPAQFRIGSHYEKGIGVSRDFTLASLWYERAANSGNARAISFYTRNGFAFDGIEYTDPADPNMIELRMVR